MTEENNNNESGSLGVKAIIGLVFAGIIFGIVSLSIEFKNGTSSHTTDGNTENASAEGKFLKGLTLMKGSDCLNCHKEQMRLVGPSFLEIAKKYKGDSAIEKTLAEKVIKGGSGAWGAIPMTAHPKLSQEDSLEMVKYILSVKEQTTKIAKSKPTAPTKHGKINGKALFDANCAVCHQKGGTGKVGLAPSIRNRDFLALASDHFIKYVIRGGRPGTAMLARPDLSEAKVNSIIAYLRSLEIKNPIDIKVDPTKKFAGNAIAGKKTYHTYCSSCHGQRGEGYSAGGSGPGIGLAGFIEHASDDYILQTLKLGRVGTPMKSFIGNKGLANLSIKDAHNIIAYLRNGISGSHPFQAPPVTSKGDIKNGKKIFATNCAVCHNTGGTGKVGLAPSIRNRDFLAIASDKFILETVKKGRPGTSMIARPDLTGQKMEDVIAYLRSLKIKNPINITVDDSKKFNGDAIKGKQYFTQYCSSCHGAEGEGYRAGGSGPGIGLKGFLSNASDDYIMQTLKQGRTGTAMKSFIGSRGLANLTEQQAKDIIAFLRSLNN